MNAHFHLTEYDRSEMLRRALEICPDLDDADMVVCTLHRCGISVAAVGATALDAAIDEARASRRDDPFIPLGRAAVGALAKIRDPI